MKIKVLELTEGCMPEIIQQGDWIDLRTAVDVELKPPFAETLRRHDQEGKTDKIRQVYLYSYLIPLGVAMEIPKGFEAILVPRSSAYNKWRIIQTNSIGIIDYTYSSDEDEWKFPVLSTGDGIIPKGTRIAQFRIQLSQKATIWQKLKWLFSNKIELVKVNSLSNPERGGFGSTGEK